MKTIFLTGFMGAGKTTVGKQLGFRLGLPVFDTDEMIESIRQTTIQELFHKEGEAAFRHCETEVLQKLSWENVIITTGGGVILKKENREWMRRKGTVIYLHAEPETIVRRLQKDQTRPLVRQKSEEDILKLYDERLPYYLEADFVVQTKNKSVTQISEEIASYLLNHAELRA